MVDDAPVQQPPSIPHAGKRHLPALDGVRGLAAISVFLFHYGDLGNSSSHVLRFINEVKLRGAYGVDIFFALSGFLITGILWDMRNANHRWLNFYRNRALRLFPLYYGLWAFLLFYCIVFHHPWYRSNFGYLFYAGNFVFPFKGLNQIGLFTISHLWSLAVEEQFYMIWPVLVWRIRNIETLKRIAFIAFFASLALKLVALGLHLNPRWSYVMLPLRLEGLCAGAFCALALRTHPEETVRIGRRIFWAVAPVMLAFFTLTALRNFSGAGRLSGRGSHCHRRRSHLVLLASLQHGVPAGCRQIQLRNLRLQHLSPRHIQGIPASPHHPHISWPRCLWSGVSGHSDLPDHAHQYQQLSPAGAAFSEAEASSVTRVTR
jgi:hypothetical protein